MTPGERAERREAVIQGLVDKGHSRERAEELIDLIAKAVFAPGKRFGRPIPPADPICNERGVPASECPAYCLHGRPIPPGETRP